MSFEDWRRGAAAGREEAVNPTVRAANHAWHRACKEIIARCVPPEMYPLAMEMLYEARKAADASLEESAAVRKLPN
jgi:enhancing lycopene biosynthesis protein 2